MDEPTMISATLARLIDDGKLDVRAIAKATGMHPSAIYRWADITSGQARDPQFTSLWRVFRAAGVAAQHAILHLLCEGTVWRCFATQAAEQEHTPASAHEAILAMASAQQALAEQLRATAEAVRDGSVNEHEQARIDQAAQRTVRLALDAAAITAEMHRRQAPRRKAKPAPWMAGGHLDQDNSRSDSRHDVD